MKATPVGRGTKLDLSIGASFDEGWQQVEEPAGIAKDEPLEPKAHRLVFKKEKRRGKTVTLVGPFFLDKAESALLLKSLKKTLGCGGTFKEGWMEFQGDVKTMLHSLLAENGFSLRSR